MPASLLNPMEAQFRATRSAVFVPQFTSLSALRHSDTHTDTHRNCGGVSNLQAHIAPISRCTLTGFSQGLGLTVREMLENLVLA